VALTPGTHVGPYEIVSLLGSGGMGEVYRARDTKLDREVAIKVLPELFVADPERVARFQREAKTLAALNHPHIGGIYGLEDGDGVRALVLELVDGPTLADRIARGPIPLDEALPIARQIAEALEAAHEAGIIHRDLKPANIKLRPDGAVKVLDFGLAKAIEPTSPASFSVTASPTITTPTMMTGIGIVLGTAAYMSPEQAKGRPADKRSDAWAFGCVLYEMLAGKRAFDGEDVSDSLANILKTEPDWTALPNDTPPAIVLLLKNCLQKNRALRVADVSAALFVFREPALGQVVRRSAPHRVVLPLAAAVVTGALVAAVAIRAWVRPAPAPVPVTRLAIPIGSQSHDIRFTLVWRDNFNVFEYQTLPCACPTIRSGHNRQVHVFDP
jgi:eukaryotic-like serine/threonine-protein kinase